MLTLLLALVTSFVNPCPNVTTVKNLNLTEYIRKPWYIQMQQETPYLPLNSNYCVRAKYSLSKKKILFYKGTVLDVYNSARLNSINGSQLNSNNSTLCARVNGMNSKLLVAPCFLPNLFAGNYWVLATGPSNDNYEFALVSGGQPHTRYSSGCSTSIDTINNSGLWLFTRNQTVSDSFIQNFITYIVSLGITPQLLNKVQQEGCVY